jgi:hypothetical protein
VFERTALEAWEDGGIELFGPLAFAEHDAAARPAEGFVGGGGDEIGVGHGAGVGTAGDEAGDVGHVDEEDRADFAGDRGEVFEVDGAGVGAGAGEDELWFVVAGEAGNIVHVDAVGFAIDAVTDGWVPAAGEVELHAVGEVAAVGEVHGEDGVADFEGGEVDGLVGGGA